MKNSEIELLKEFVKLKSFVNDENEKYDLFEKLIKEREELIDGMKNHIECACYNCVSDLEGYKSCGSKKCQAFINNELLNKIQED